MLSKKYKLTTRQQNELRSYREFFTAWFGNEWQRKLEWQYSVPRRQLVGILNLERPFCLKLAAQLHAIQTELAVGAAAGAAKRTPERT
jgi:hypothetical protein